MSSNLERRTNLLSEQLGLIGIEHSRLERVKYFREAYCDQLSTVNSGERRSNRFLALGPYFFISPLVLLAVKPVFQLMGMSPVYTVLGLGIVVLETVYAFRLLRAPEVFRISRRNATIRFLVAILWAVLVALDPGGGVSRVFGASQKYGAWGALGACVITTLVGVACLGPLDLKLNKSSETYSATRWSSLKTAVVRFTTHLEEFDLDDRRERHVDIIFTAIAALILNSFVLVGGLQYPLAYLLGLGILVSVLILTWQFKLGQLRNRKLYIGRGVSDADVLALVSFVGLVLFCASSLIDGKDGRTLGSLLNEPLTDRPLPYANAVAEEFVASFNRDDLLIFCLQFGLVFCTTAIPVVCMRLYKREPSIEYAKDSVIFSMSRGRRVQINQATCVVTVIHERKVLVEKGFWLPLYVLMGDGSEILLRMYWGADGRGRDAKFSFKTAIVEEGANYYFIGAPSLWLRMRTLLDQRISGRRIVRERHRLDVKRLSGGTEPKSTTWDDGGFPFLDVYGVPPYIPDDSLPISLRQHAPSTSTEARASRGINQWLRVALANLCEAISAKRNQRPLGKTNLSSHTPPHAGPA